MDPALRKAIYDKYIAPTQKQRPDYIGVEIEMPVVNLANEPVDERVALAAAEQFAAHFGFQITGRGAGWARNLCLRRSMTVQDGTAIRQMICSAALRTVCRSGTILNNTLRFEVNV